MIVLRKLDDQSNFTVIEKWKSIEFHESSLENFSKEEMQSAMNLFAAPPRGEYFHA